MNAKILIAAALVTLTALVWGDGGAVSSAQTTGGTVVIGVGNDAAITNPNLSGNQPDIMIGCIIYEGLVSSRMDGKADPLLAKSWTQSTDGLVYTFNLVDAKWQDGQPFTAADVKYTFEQVIPKYSALLSRVAANIRTIETPDPRTVVVRLAHPYGPFLFALDCQFGGAILPAHLFQGTDPTKNPTSLTKPVGTGPFRLSAWAPGDRIILTKNTDYRVPNAPRLDRIVVQIIPSASSRLLALQSGQVQYLPYLFVNFNDYNTIRSNSNLYLHDQLFPPPDDILFFNVRSGPTSKVEVRQALATAIDRDYLLKSVWFGVGNAGVSPFDSRIAWAHDPQTDYRKLYPFNPDKANTMLDAAGYKRGADGTRFTLTYVTSASQSAYVSAGEALKSMLAAVGVNLKLEMLDQTAVGQRVFLDGAFDLSLQGYSTFGDPALGIVRDFISSTIKTSFGNASGYSNPRVDELAELGQKAVTQADRARHYHEIQKIIANDLPSLILHERVAYDAATRRLQGLWTGHLGFGDWSKAWIERP